MEMTGRIVKKSQSWHFSPDYLNLNIVRYNVGGGDKPDSSIKRVEGRVQGWSKDMFGTDDGSGTFLGNDFYQKDPAQMNDAGQIWMMEQANKWRFESNDIINEVFQLSAVLHDEIRQFYGRKQLGQRELEGRLLR